MRVETHGGNCLPRRLFKTPGAQSMRGLANLQRAPRCASARDFRKCDATCFVVQPALGSRESCYGVARDHCFGSVFRPSRCGGQKAVAWKTRSSGGLMTALRLGVSFRLQQPINMQSRKSSAVWSSGMILAQGARGPGFNSRNSPIARVNALEPDQLHVLHWKRHHCSALLPRGASVYPR